MRGAPQVEFSTIIRKISSRNYLLTDLLPTPRRFRESHFQYNLKPARCQRITVSVWTRIKTRRQSGHRRRRMTQNSLSGVENRGREQRRSNAASCCLRLGFPEGGHCENKPTELKGRTKA